MKKQEHNYQRKLEQGQWKNMVAFKSIVFAKW